MIQREEKELRKGSLIILVLILSMCVQYVWAEEAPAGLSGQDILDQKATEKLVDHNTQNVRDAITKHGAVVYTYIPNQLFRVYCQEQRLVDIQLQPGEELIYIGGGDTVRWVVDKEISGAGASKQWHVYIKPLKSGLTTNFVINTDKHTYHLELIATTWYTPVITWVYPQEEKIALLRQKAEAEKREEETIPLGNGNLENLNFGYKISDKRYPWKPTMVFDDGLKTYIQMPAEMKSSEAPALFIKEGKELMLVNYRVKNNYYIVDRLFDEAELRCGTKEVVVIKNVSR